MFNERLEVIIEKLTFTFNALQRTKSNLKVINYRFCENQGLK